LHFNFSSLTSGGREPHSFAAGCFWALHKSSHSINRSIILTLLWTHHDEMHASKHSWVLDRWFGLEAVGLTRPFSNLARGWNIITPSHVVGLHQIKRTASVGARHLISSQISAYKCVTAPIFLFSSGLRLVIKKIFLQGALLPCEHAFHFLFMAWWLFLCIISQYNTESWKSKSIRTFIM